MKEIVNLEDLKDSKKYLVVKSNKLIEAKYKLSLNEQRLIHTLISKIKSDDEEFKEYYIKVTELKDLFDLEDTTYYSKIKKITENLLGKTLSIQEEDGLLQINWISSAKYLDNEGYVKLCFDPKLKPYLLQLKNYFTAYGLDNVIRLKSIYAIRLYELLLKEYRYYGQKRINFIFGIKELKEMLSI
jgi:plasmid replication initiation protein